MLFGNRGFGEEQSLVTSAPTIVPPNAPPGAAQLNPNRAAVNPDRKRLNTSTHEVSFETVNVRCPQQWAEQNGHSLTA